jgi:DNA-binding CsgD family transcriptional regulator
MTRIIYHLPINPHQHVTGIFGSSVHASTLIWDDSLPASSLVSAINVGAYHFPMTQPPELVHAIQQGDVVFVTPAVAPDRQDVHLPLQEKRVLIMLAEGCSLQQIAHQLGVTPRTVTGYLSRLKRRLKAGTRDQLIARAVALNLCKPSMPSK